MKDKLFLVATSLTILLGLKILESKKPANAQITRIGDIAKVCNWEFGRSDGSVIAPSMQLVSSTNSSGSNIRGYKNPNEHTWSVSGGKLVFRNRSGDVTTRFNRASINGGKLFLDGDIVTSPPFTHTLECN